MWKGVLAFVGFHTYFRGLVSSLSEVTRNLIFSLPALVSFLFFRKKELRKALVAFYILLFYSFLLLCFFKVRRNDLIVCHKSVPTASTNYTTTPYSTFDAYVN